MIILLFFTGLANFNLTDAIIDKFHSSFLSYVKKYVVSKFFVYFVVSVIFKPLFNISLSQGFSGRFYFCRVNPR